MIVEGSEGNITMEFSNEFSHFERLTTVMAVSLFMKMGNSREKIVRLMNEREGGRIRLSVSSMGPTNTATPTETSNP